MPLASPRRRPAARSHTILLLALTSWVSIVPPRTARAETLGDSVSVAAPLSTAPADSSRVVRVLSPTLVRASRIDAMSSEVRHRITSSTLGSLPIDRPADALALLPGVVIDGDLVHVRGGRPGELRVLLDGIALNEPFRGEAVELPLIALDGLELATGGLEADGGGGLAGTLTAIPHAAGERWRGRVAWQHAAPGDSPDDRAGARVSGPIASTGAGIALAAEARLDDASLPSLRTPQRTRVLGASLGWRARNQVTATARLAPVREPGRLAVQAIVSRRLLRPWNPMFSLVGWTSPCPDDDCLQGPSYSPTPVQGQRYSPYNAADHDLVTDIQRQTIVLSAQRLGHRERWKGALGWNREKRVTSVNGIDDERLTTPGGRAQFGLPENGTSDPFHVWTGDAPYFRRSRAEWIEGRLEWRREWASGSAIGAGGSLTHERVHLKELDLAYFPAPYDSIRIFTESAPGASGWITARWALEGLVVNGGLRWDWYSPGPEAERTLHLDPPRSDFNLSPRIGLSYPLSPRQALQFSYARVSQSPGREYVYDSRTARIVARHPLGNPALEPATAISYEASFRQLAGPAGHWRAGFFMRDLYRQISARNVRIATPGGSSSGESVLRYASEDAGRAVGFEASLEHPLADRGQLHATYTWMRAEGSESFENGVPFYPLGLPQPVAIAEYPLSWDQRHRLTVALTWRVRRITLASSTVIASGFPWTPAALRAPAGDLGDTHSRRLGSYSITDATARTRLPASWGGFGLGLEIRNFFDFRGARRVSVDGWPNPLINTAYDDYAAYRELTGQGGGAYWDDVDGDGRPGWVRVGDPRLDFPPRMIRFAIEREW